MNIGSVSQNSSGNLVGFIQSLALDLSIVLRPVTRRHERSPSFDILARNVAGRYIAIGAFWEKPNSKTGEIYYSGRIEDPSLAEPMNIVAFPQEDRSLSIAWSRPNLSAAGVYGGRSGEPDAGELARAPGFSGDDTSGDTGGQTDDAPAQAERRGRTRRCEAADTGATA